MAFPTGYTKYQEITIDHLKVSADLTDFIVYVNLADLVEAGADIFDTCRSDGGDIRVTKTDGTTELPREVVAIDTTAKTGELHIKFTGTLSSSVDTVIRIYYNGVDTEPSVSSTYGRNAVWSAYKLVYHGVDSTTSLALDSTGNGNDGVKRSANQPLSQSSGLFGSELDFFGTDYIRKSHASFATTTTPYTNQGWFKLDNLPASATSFRLWCINGGLNDGAQDKQIYIEPSGRMSAQVYTGSSVISMTATGYVAPSTYYMAHSVFNASTLQLFANGLAQTPASATTSYPAGAGAGFQVSDQIGASKYVNGVMKEIRLRYSALSSNWITTEYNNQNSPSTFYATGNEAGGTVGVTINPSAQALAFSIPAYSVKKGVRQSPTAQSLAFSIHAYTVKIPKVVIAGVQVATFSIPAYTVTVGGNVTISPSAQVLTFSIPAYTVGGGALVMPNGQTLTFSIPEVSVTVQASVTVSPNTMVLTFSIPSLTKAGGVWSKSGRNSSGDWTATGRNSSGDWVKTDRNSN